MTSTPDLRIPGHGAKWQGVIFHAALHHVKCFQHMTSRPLLPSLGKNPDSRLTQHSTVQYSTHLYYRTLGMRSTRTCIYIYYVYIHIHIYICLYIYILKYISRSPSQRPSRFSNEEIAFTYILCSFRSGHLISYGVGPVSNINVHMPTLPVDKIGIH